MAEKRGLGDMTSLLSHLNPTPSFPSYTGPYTVGTVDVELPTSDLNSPSSAPAPDPSIPTVQFRIFYPCDPPAKKPKHVYWLPDPQREYLGAYARFLGAGVKLSELFSFLPRLLYYVTIPALRHAPLAVPPTRAQRWPVMVFSHGLGGSRNAYSHITGSLASHGMVVIAPEHRDGTGPVSFIRDADGRQTRAVNYVEMPHKKSVEVLDGRDQQLSIRLWELGLVHDALLKIDRGEGLHNYAADSLTKTGTSDGDLDMFREMLDVNTPGKISWSGHSFGAATIVQFVKSVFYRRAPRNSEYKPLYTPSEHSALVQQITPSTHISLLDLWVLPLRSLSTRWLWAQPLPCYSPGGPGGSNLLAILSEAFFKWQQNLNHTKQAVSEDPCKERGYSESSSRMPPPYIFYPVTSAHLSQSDFGVLFPWLTKKVFNSVEPERALRLNVRAILEVMRENGIEVADTSAVDMEMESKGKHHLANGHANGTLHGHRDKLPGQDHKILAADGSVRGWVKLSIDGETQAGEASNTETRVAADPNDAVMSGEVTNGGIENQKL